MKLNLTKLSALVLSLELVLSGCGDQTLPLEPAAVAPASVAIVEAVAEVLPLHRTVPLSANVSVTSRIGSKGGRVELPGAGIKISLPANAVAEPVAITVTALAGSAVAYTFEPHGLLFNRPVRVDVSLKGTTAERNRPVQDLVEAGYFPDGLMGVDTTGTIPVVEVLPVSFDKTRSTAAFLVQHFSGYLLTSGRKK